MAPVALSIEIAKVETRLLSESDICNGTSDFARHKRAPTARALVIEEDTVARVHVVGLTVVLRNPEGIQFCNAVGAAGVEWRVLVLRDGLDKTIKLGSRRLIKSHVVVETTGTHCVEETQGTESVDIASVLGHVERDLDV